MNNSEGLDVSKWDVAPIDFSLYRADLDWVSIKVSEGTEIDPLFRQQWAAARGRVARIAYHFWRSYVDQKAAVRTMLEYLGDDPGELEVALDLELEDGATDVMNRAKIWSDEYNYRTGKWPIIYSRWFFLRDNGAFAKTIWGQWKHGWLANCKLWLAEYPFDEIWSLPGYAQLGDALRAVLIEEVMTGKRTLSWPSTPGPFKNVDIWQWTSRLAPSYIPGYYLGSGHKKAVDHNFWRLSREEFNAAYPLAAVEPPPATGGTMEYEGKVIWANGATIRSIPNTSGATIKIIPAGTLLHGTELVEYISGEKWLGIDKYQVPGGAWTDQGGYVAAFYSGSPRVEYSEVKPAITISVDITANVDGILYGANGISLTKRV